MHEASVCDFFDRRWDVVGANMYELRLDELRQIEIEILDYLYEICKKNHLKFYLAYGTLLGAVRHKEFIPWDDDIDVWMPREDYKRLNQIMEHEKGRFRLLSYEMSKDYFYPFAKMVDSSTRLIEKRVPRIQGLGVYIDIFPLDVLPQNKKQIKKIFRRSYILRGIICNSLGNEAKFYKEEGFIRFLKCKICGLFSWRKCSEYWHKTIRNYTPGSRYVGCLDNGKDAFVYAAKAFEKVCDLEFEKKLYPAPAYWDYILHKIYGDYWELPPVDQRVTNHNFKAWRIY